MKSIKNIVDLIPKIISFTNKISFWISVTSLGIFLFWIALDYLPLSLVFVLSILVVVILIYLRWFFTRKSFVEILFEAEECKDKEKAIEILEDALIQRLLSNLEEAKALRTIGEFYEELGDSNRADNYYTEAIKNAKINLDIRDLSQVDKLETLGELVLIYFIKKDYKQSSYYFEILLDFGLNVRNFFLDKRALIPVLSAYVYSGKKQRGIEIYNTLLKRKKCKRNKEAERLLGI